MIRRVLQVTDCHLFRDPGADLRGVVTWPRFRAVLAEIAARLPEFDLLVFTGDTAHDHLAETYARVRSELERAFGSLERVRFIPGNHDDRAAMREVFGESQLAPLDGCVAFEHSWPQWRVIGLDSQIPDQLPGELGPEQCTWLLSRLEAAPELPALLLLHHPPVPVRSAWLDRIGLQDVDRLHVVLANHPQVRLIGCGHVHHETASPLGAVPVFTTSAVGPPFLGHAPELVIASRPPMFRLFELGPGSSWWTHAFSADGTAR